MVNINSGSRFDTYVIEGKRGSKEICLNGVAARLGVVGDRIIIMAYAEIETNLVDKYNPKKIVVNESNDIVSCGQKLVRETLYESIV